MSSSTHRARCLDRPVTVLQRLFCSALALLLFGCGAAAEYGQRTGLEGLRDAYRTGSLEPEGLRWLAVGELLHPSGGGTASGEVLRAARRALPQDASLAFLAGRWFDLHGDRPAAIEAYLSAWAAAAANPGHEEAGRAATLSLSALFQLADVDGTWADTVPRALRATLAAEDGLPASLRQKAHLLLAAASLREGAPDAAAAHARSAGCLMSWQVAGPFGPHEGLLFDEELPPDRTPRGLRQRYHLGPGRQLATTRRHRATACKVTLSDPVPEQSGIYFAEATFHVAQEGPQLLRVESTDSLRVWVDGKLLLVSDRRSASGPRVRFLTATLDTGSHRARVEVLPHDSQPSLSVAVIHGDGLRLPPVVSARRGHGLAGRLSGYLHGWRALSRGAPIDGRRWLRAVGEQRPTTLLWQELAAALAVQDPHASATHRRNEAQQLFRRMAEGDPTHWLGSFRLAQSAAEAGSTEEALAGLRALHEAFPGVDEVTAAFAELLLRQGWAAEGHRVLAAVLVDRRPSCALLPALVGAEEQLGRWQEARRWAQRTWTCGSLRDLAYRVAANTGDFSAAARSLTGIANLTAPDQRPGLFQSELELARAVGDDARVAELLERTMHAQPRSLNSSLAAIDQRIANNQRAEAVRLLDARFRAQPSSQLGLWRLREYLSGETQFGAHRLDGAEVIAAFEKSQRRYDAPELMVLDHTIVRVFPDGSSLELTHNIWKIQAEEAVDQRGEFSVPDGAELLVLHTIRPDGRRVEPTLIPGKDSYSLPGIVVGTYVEYAYLVAQPATPRFPSGYLGRRFFFQNLEDSFDLSRLTVIIPAELESVVIEARGEAPPLEDKTEGGLRVLEWTARESHAFRPEPGAVPAEEWLPSVNVAVRADWRAVVRHLRALLADKDPTDPAITRLVASVLADAHAASPRARAKALYDWVLDHIEESGEFFADAPSMVRDRTGSRARVLRYLLSEAGLDAELAFARSLAEDQAVGAESLPEPGRFRELLVRFRPPGESAVYLMTGERFLPFGFVFEHLLGQPAIRLTEGAPIERIPPSAFRDDHEIAVVVSLSPAGAATFQVEERLMGAGAARWRADLEQIPEALLEERFEQFYLSQVLPGAHLESLRVTEVARAEAPIVLTYSASHPNFARRQDDQLLVPYVWKNNLRTRLAPAATRRTPALIAPGINFRAHVTVEQPEGWVSQSPRDPTVLAGPNGATFSFSATTTGQAVVIEEAVNVPLARLTPEDYGDFAAFCQAADAAELREWPFIQR